MLSTKTKYRMASFVAHRMPIGRMLLALAIGGAVMYGVKKLFTRDTAEYLAHKAEEAQEAFEELNEARKKWQEEVLDEDMLEEKEEEWREALQKALLASRAALAALKKRLEE